MINLEKINKIHCIGIAGMGLSGVAKILREMGKEVTGSEAPREKLFGNSLTVIKDLEKAGVPVLEFSEKNIKPDLDLVIVATSWTEGVEAKKAIEMGLKTVPESEMRATFMELQQGIAVAGIHGKTTTTSLISHLLEKGGLDPTFLVGTGIVPSLQTNAKFGRGKYYIVEADEYYKSEQEQVSKFLDMRPFIEVITSVEFDHPDFFKDFGQVRESFRKFAQNLQPGGFIIACGDNAEAKKIAANSGKRFYTYGLGEKNDWQAKNIGFDRAYTFFEVWQGDENLGEFKVKLFGKHNIQNTLAAIAVAHEAGLETEVIKKHLAEFISPERRFQEHKIGDLLFLDDYGHHPTAIATTWDAIKQKYNNKKIWFVFSPHMLSRTRALRSEFAKALTAISKDKDVKGVEVLLTDIFFAARERREDAKAEMVSLLAAIKAQNGKVQHTGSVKETYNYLKDRVGEQDLIVTMGAGDVCEIRDYFGSPAPGHRPPALPKWPAGVDVRENEVLAPCTTFKIGGPARYFAKIAREEDLLKILKTARKNNLPYYILGGGSNVLVSDEGFNGLVIKLELRDWKIKKLGREFKAGKWQKAEQHIEFGAGMRLADIVDFAAKTGLTGLEWAAGIPGTFGGAIFGNAEAFQRSTADRIVSVRDLILKDAKVRERPRKRIKFSYRHSDFKEKRDSVILSAIIKLKPADPAKVKEAVKTVMAERKARAVKNTRSAGCFFKNIILKDCPPKIVKRFKKDLQKGALFLPTGLLVDRLGLKGTRVGGAMVALEHGNFILNHNNATASDILKLAAKIKEAVKKEYGLELEEEVQMVGFDN